MEETEKVRVRWKQGQGLLPEEPQQFTVEPLQEVEPAKGTEKGQPERQRTLGLCAVGVRHSIYQI